MKKRIYLARHGETDWSLEKRMQGRTDIPLNATGEAQAEALAGALAGLKIDRIVSSPLKRAARTAEIIVNRLGLGANFDSGLAERSFGEAEGLCRPEILEKFGHLIADGEDGPREREIRKKFGYAIVVRDGRPDWSRTSIPGGESLEEVQERLDGALGRICACDGDNILIVTHGANIQKLLGGIVTRNCCCFAAIYDTETGEMSEVECVYEGCYEETNLFSAARGDRLECRKAADGRRARPAPQRDR
jgi:broad specificity phosphatase PhoE